ncbi:MAG: phosphoesterase, partial [Acidobacteriales bacterium]|nr:phosphoesterase [Terriglobales bacterium]
DLTEGVKRIVQGGGLPSLAHPIRISRDPERLDQLIAGLVGYGPLAVEAYHSEHSPQDTKMLLSLADRHRLPVSGGSDFHGANKPGILLGTGRNGNLSISRELLENLRCL